jgi:hypothetical protein
MPFHQETIRTLKSPNPYVQLRYLSDLRYCRLYWHRQCKIGLHYVKV